MRTMMDKNDIRTMTTPRRGGFMDDLTNLSNLSIRKVSLKKVLQMEITHKQMAKMTGLSEYEIRRELGLLV